MCGAYILKANLPAGFDIDPPVVRETTTRKSDPMRPFGVDKREFEVAIERCGMYQLPFHDGWMITHHAGRRCDLNHWSGYCVVNKVLSAANLYRMTPFTPDRRGRIRAEDRSVR